MAYLLSKTDYTASTRRCPVTWHNVNQFHLLKDFNQASFHSLRLTEPHPQNGSPMRQILHLGSMSHYHNHTNQSRLSISTGRRAHPRLSQSYLAMTVNGILRMLLMLRAATAFPSRNRTMQAVKPRLYPTVVTQLISLCPSLYGVATGLGSSLREIKTILHRMQLARQWRNGRSLGRMHRKCSRIRHQEESR